MTARSRKRSSRSSRTRLEPDARRTQLLVLGRRIFAERPYDTVSIDEIARAAEISKGLLYHYFPTKRDFYVAVLRDASRELLERTEPRPSASPIESLRDGLDVYHDYVSRHAPSYAALLHGGVGSDKDVARIVDEIREMFIDRIVEGMHLPEPTPLLRSALRGWIGFLEVTVLDWIEHRRVDRVALREVQIEVLLAVLRAALGDGAGDLA